jgi:hypothetical protein
MATEIDYGAVLTDLEAKRTAIESAIAGVRQMLNLGAEQAVGTQASNERRDTSSVVRFDSFFRMSVPAAIIKFLEIAKVPQSVSEVSTALLAGGFKTTSKNFMPIVGSNLSRLKAAGETVNVEGKWGLASWYPAARKESPQKLQKGRKRGRPKANPSVTAKVTPEQKTTASKLTAAQIEQIKVLHAGGNKLADIAKTLGVHHFAVMHAIKSVKGKVP